MGASFGSIQVRGEDREAVKTAAEAVSQERKQKFLIGPLLNGWIAVYPDGSGQDEASATALSKQLGNKLLQLIVHDDDIFAYNFFQSGELLNRYSSRPDYFSKISSSEREILKPNLELFRDLVGSPSKLDALSRLLDTTEKVDFEQSRLGQFAKLLGIHNTLTCYEYLTAGDRDGITKWKQFIHVPDQTAEKSAKKEAEAALRREKLEWRKRGLLCNEWLPPGGRRSAPFPMPEFCTDPVNGGFLALWQMGYGHVPQLLELEKPWPRKAETVPLTFRSAFPGKLTMSFSGKWFAFFDEGLRLWNWRERQELANVNVRAIPITFTKDEKHLLCHVIHTATDEKSMSSRSERKLGIISLETQQVVQTIQTGTGPNIVTVIHPHDVHLLTQYTSDQWGIFDLHSKELVKVLYTGPLTDFSRLGDRRRLFVRTDEQVLNATFSSDGHFLCCATINGLRVHSWDALLAASETTLEPRFTVTPRPEARFRQNYIYDAVLDEEQNRVLFCGLEGTMRFLNLRDGSTGILLDPPGKSPIWRLQLSRDRKFICCICFPVHEERDHKPPRLQVWNYEALCKEAGLS